MLSKREGTSLLLQVLY